MEFIVGRWYKNPGSFEEAKITWAKFSNRSKSNFQYSEWIFNGKYEINYLINCHYSGLSNYEVEEKKNQLRKDFAANNFSSFKDTSKDEMFIIPASKLNIDEIELEVNSEFTAKKIAAKFSKTLNSRKTSRLLLNNLISYIV